MFLFNVTHILDFENFHKPSIDMTFMQMKRSFNIFIGPCFLTTDTSGKASTNMTSLPLKGFFMFFIGRYFKPRGFSKNEI